MPAIVFLFAGMARSYKFHRFILFKITRLIIKPHRERCGWFLTASHVPIKLLHHLAPLGPLRFNRFPSSYKGFIHIAQASEA